MRRQIDCEFQIGDIVYLKTSRDRVAGMVTGLIVRQTGVSYLVSWDGNEIQHFEIELCDEWNPAA